MVVTLRGGPADGGMVQASEDEVRARMDRGAGLLWTMEAEDGTILTQGYYWFIRRGRRYIAIYDHVESGRIRRGDA